MPTLCLVTHTLSRSDGQGRVNAETAVALAVGGRPVHVVASSVSPELAAMPALTWHRVAIPRWVPTALLRNQWFAAKGGRATRRVARVIDLLQLNGAIVYGATGGVNVANFVHGDWLRSPCHPVRGGLGAAAVYQWVYTRLNAAWERRAFRRAERVVAVSGQVRDALVRHAGVDPAKVDVIEPGVDPEQFRPPADGEPNALRPEMGPLPADAVVLLFVGDVRSNRKNLDLVLAALTRLPARVVLAVVGDASRSPYPAMVDRMGLGGRVRFLGRRTTDLPGFMRGADAFVFPSHYDPFALVVTEAMASGLPVVTAPTVGASELIRDGENGFVLDGPTDLGGLVRVLTGLADDPGRRAAVGRAARRSVEHRTWAAMAARYEEVYRQVLARRRDGRSPSPATGRPAPDRTPT